jgi:hypothetical protein
MLDLMDPRIAGGDDRDVVALSVKCNEFVDPVPTDLAARFVYAAAPCFWYKR